MVNSNILKKCFAQATRNFPNIEVLRSAFPKTLRKQPHWLVYMVEQKKDNRTDKIPVHPETGCKLAGWNKPDNLMTFKRAAKALSDNIPGNIKGIGYVPSEDDEITVIDLDEAVENNQPKAWAKEIIEMFDTYTEISPSGKGYHLFFWGKPPDITKVKRPIPGGLRREGVEIFCRTGFITLTGNIYNDYNIIKESSNFSWLWEKYFAKKNKTKIRTKAVSYWTRAPSTDDEIIAKLSWSNSYKKFKTLMKGDASDYDEDFSRADLALCSILARYTRDASQIDRIFRTSGLLRDKWDETGHYSDTPNLTYGQHTIEKALELCSNDGLDEIVDKIRVLGHTTDFVIFLWADGHLHRIKHQTLDKTTIMILTGATNTDVISQIRQYILDEAHKKGIISETKILGPGVWKFENAFLIHTGTQAFSYDGKSLTKIEEPTYSNHIIEFSNEDWIRCKSLKEGLSGGDLSTAFHKLHDYIKPFSWAEAEIGEYAACFTMLAPLQQAMSWRPLLYLLGPRGCGKTLFLDHILSTIYGPLVCSLDKATSYAMAQEIGNTCRIGVFDEFENNKRMSEIIEHAKLFGRECGGYIKRGTPGAQALSYKFNHMVWFASIYSARQLKTDSAASSRAIIFNMKKPDINGIPPAKMSAKAGKILAGYIVGTMIRHWTQISDVKEEILRNPPIAQGESPSRLESRTIENFAYASAILNIVLKQHRCVPNWANPEIEDDGDKILRSIMESVVLHPRWAR